MVARDQGLQNLLQCLLAYMFDEENFPNIVCLFTVLYFSWKRVNLMIEMGLFHNPERFSLLHNFMLCICEWTMS